MICRRRVDLAADAGADVVLVNRRLASRIEPGPKAYEFRLWLTTALPILMVEGFYLLLAYTDVLDAAAVPVAGRRRGLLRGRQDAGAGLLHLLSRSRPRPRIASAAITSPATAQGCPPSCAQSIKWTFWPSLAATALLLAFGRPMLSLFGPQFTDGYHLMFILAVGLLARAAIGPMERLLNMLGEQRICALVYASAFAVNLGLCFVLIPRLGTAGAAIATATALIVETILLFIVTKTPARLPRFHLEPAKALSTKPCTARSNSLFRVEWRPLAELAALSRRNGARSPAARSSPTSSMSRPSR